MFRKALLVAGGGLTFVGAVYAGFVVGKVRELEGGAAGRGGGGALAGIGKVVTNAQRRLVFEDIARKYDDEINLDEMVMGVPLIRYFHFKKAAGKTLEVGCGTGRSFRHIPDDCHVVAVDAAQSMVDKAQAKAEELSKTNFHVLRMDAHQLQFPDNEFDTVIDSFGLCSYDDPVHVLQEMARVCKPYGQILLVEHGRSDYDFITRMLDASADDHAEKWGCWWNRPIDVLVEQAGLTITSSRTWHFGTTYVLECTPALPVHKSALPSAPDR